MSALDAAPALIVPGTERRPLARAKDVRAVVLDLTGDDVAAARGRVVDTLGSDGWGAAARLVRVNGWATPHTYRDVIEVVESAGDELDAIVLPGVRTSHDAAALDLLLGQIETTMGLSAGAIGIVAQLDDARGVQAAATIATMPRLAAIACNACEFAPAVLLAARAADLPAYCLAGDAARVERARADGFDGVWVADPALLDA